jgi:hypothetical protein
LAVKKTTAEQMWRWFCGNCGNEQVQEESPKFNGERYTCTYCQRDTLVASVAPPKDLSGSGQNSAELIDTITGAIGVIEENLPKLAVIKLRNIINSLPCGEHNNKRDVNAQWEAYAHLYEVTHPDKVLNDHDKMIYMAGWQAASTPIL